MKEESKKETCSFCWLAWVFLIFLLFTILGAKENMGSEAFSNWVKWLTGF
ncbi:hypothetical protein [Marinibactrum halimedae]|nr:hypothetical protein [Marinibactrum halimedae]MCD9458447.1 hypothetical protein [Marinibactrum halimedae]